jgi:type 1 fimbria pilin
MMTQQIFRRLTNLALAVCALAIFNAAVFAQGTITNSDIRPGSVLFFNRYTSNPNNPQFGDTQVNITNVHPSQSASIHLFFVDGATCSIADFGMSLTPNQTMSFLMSEYDPGIQGYLVAVATDGSVPEQFNFLVGTAFIRESDGRQAILPAITVLKLSPGTIEPKEDGSYSMRFNGAEYERLPSALALTSFNSETTDSNTLIIYSPSRDLVFGSTDSVSIFTLLYDDAEKSISGNFSVRCYRTDTLTTLFNRGGGVNRHVPAGRTGWIKLSATGRPLLGSVISRGPVFSGGYNLPAITLLSSYEITLPVF